jgi:hypothetical protein
MSAIPFLDAASLSEIIDIPGVVLAAAVSAVRIVCPYADVASATANPTPNAKFFGISILLVTFHL